MYLKVLSIAAIWCEMIRINGDLNNLNKNCPVSLCVRTCTV